MFGRKDRDTFVPIRSYKYTWDRISREEKLERYPDQAFARKEIIARISNLCSGIPYGKFLLLRYLEGYSWRELSSHWGMSIIDLKIVTSQALRHLQQKLGAEIWQN